MSKCRKCKADIVFAKTERGKWMPYNVEPDSNGTLVLIGSDNDGQPLVKVADLFTTSDETRYMAHWATCSDPEFFRGKKQ